MKSKFKAVVAVIAVLAVLLALVVIALGIALHLGIPQNAAGMAAKGVCSAAFVAGRPWRDMMAQDVLPASPLLAVVNISVDEKLHAVTADFAGLFPRRAVLVRDRGCVLDGAPDSGTRPDIPRPRWSRPWPVGDVPLPPDQWGPDVDAARLQKVVDSAFIGAGDPTSANTRGLAVVYRGRLLVLREAEGFMGGTRLHGWSMTKTVAGMLFYKIAVATGLSLDTPVVDAFLPGREPAWVGEWRKDARANITVRDLLYMRDGLATTEDYAPWGSVPRMLWGAPDMAAWAAGHPSEVPAGQRWQYLSATANLLAAVSRGRFKTDEEYWAYPARALFDQIGARTPVIETDASGNWVASSYMWASTADWARLGLLMLGDGQWGEYQVLPHGWLKLASTPSTAIGGGRGYGAQTWLFGRRESRIDCQLYPEIPEDTIAMGGHWGQVVAMVPSRELVVVRLGWTFDGDKFDDCKLMRDILSAFPR